MALSNYTRLLLDLLENQEAVTSRLYELYAARFPAHREMWQRMSRDENNHAKWIRTIRAAVEKGAVTVDPKILRIEELQNLSLLLKDRLAKAESPQISLTQALRTASEIEGSFLEQPFRKVFGADKGKAALLLFKLETETMDHANEIRATIERLQISLAETESETGPKFNPRK